MSGSTQTKKQARPVYQNPFTTPEFEAARQSGEITGRDITVFDRWQRTHRYADDYGTIASLAGSFLTLSIPWVRRRIRSWKGWVPTILAGSFGEVAGNSYAYNSLFREFEHKRNVERAIARSAKLPPQVWFMRNAGGWMRAPPSTIPSTVPTDDIPVEESQPLQPPPETSADHTFNAEDSAESSSPSPAPTPRVPQPAQRPVRQSTPASTSNKPPSIWDEIRAKSQGGGSQTPSRRRPVDSGTEQTYEDTNTDTRSREQREFDALLEAERQRSSTGDERENARVWR